MIMFKVIYSICTTFTIISCLEIRCEPEAELTTQTQSNPSLM